MESDEAVENIDLFIDMYTKKRIEYHLRKVKSDKMMNLMVQPPVSNSSRQPAPRLPPRLPQRQPQPVPGGYGGYGGY